MAAMADVTDETRFKCKKCRNVILTSPPNTYSERSEGDEGNVFSVEGDTAPPWINSSVEQGGWTKGKLLCPECGCRVGGFDFVGGGTAPIYIVKSKVDIWKAVEAAALSSSIHNNSTTTATESTAAPVSSSSSESSSNTASSAMNSSGAEPSTSSGSGLESVAASTHPTPSSEASSEESEDESRDDGSSNFTDHESSTDEEEPRTRRQLHKTKRRRRRRIREKMKKRENQSSQDRVEAKVRELLELEPELEELPDDVMCPVCLDLLHEPFQTEPCRHIFCEPCLRRLGQKNPMNTKCPLCRTRIRFCKHLAATSREIREEHEPLYLRRKKFERSTPVYSYPLPWTPGWRNLIRGRPLGGNRLMVEDNHAQYFRTILHQLPYYIPPVMFANLLNIVIFAFMIGFVEVLPTVLYTMFGSGKGGENDPNNITDAAIVPEISGESLPTEDDSDRQPMDDIPAVVEKLGAEALDSTFYFILFFLSLLAAVLGQFIIQQDPGERARFQYSDILLVVCLTCVPLLVIPTLLPYRVEEGHYLGGVLKKLLSYVLGHFSIHSFVIVLLLAWFLYHCDTDEDILG